ncbi:MAG: formimidoylglutamate deiminase, partial [Nocardioidaceae bacterium]
MTAYWCEQAWLGPGDIAASVLVHVTGSHILKVSRDEAPGDAVRLAGLTIPGFANCHSHAFHRALRGRTQREKGSFWTWRETMYDVAARLDPDTYYSLARATYEEMLLTGITAVGEFHYLHHGPDGRRYADANAMGHALISAARDAGLRMTLLDTCYISAGFGAPVEGVQGRFSDGDAERWAQRVSELKGTGAADGTIIGAAIHSVRAVPRDQLASVAGALPVAPLHVHLSEQVAENDACMAAWGLTPTGLLAENGVVSDRLSAVHATHLTDADITTLASARSNVCFCPTTERDLADGVGPARELVDAGARLTLGSDSHAVIDAFEEMRAVELDARLARQVRGHFQAAELLTAATATGHASLGFDDAGRIAEGQWADLVTLAVDSPRMAGTGGSEEGLVFAASPADVTSVVASGV